MSNVTILGLWHLGSVTAACMARHHSVIGVDFDIPVITALLNGNAPLHEPGLDALIAEGLKSGNLTFTSDPTSARTSDVVWVCYDTPVDENDSSDLVWVMSRIAQVMPHLRAGTVVLISSQLPVGTCAQLSEQHPQLHFACSPENLRLGKAIDAFEKPARLIVGATAPARAALEALLTPIGAPLVWMRPESAEMVKHALNSFLALSVAFINEIATVSEQVGADAYEVAQGLKTEPRIGPRAYLSPGGPFAGGTLARDVVTLSTLGETKHVPLTLIPSIKESNDRHRRWNFSKLSHALTGIPQPTVAVLGLAYTPNTNTLRRSSAVELCRELIRAGIAVRAYDPLIRATDDEHSDIPLSASALDAAQGAHAVVICTEYPEFRNYPWDQLLDHMARRLVVDANRIVEKAVTPIPGVVYLTVGRP